MNSPRLQVSQNDETMHNSKTLLLLELIAQPRIKKKSLNKRTWVLTGFTAHFKHQECEDKEKRDGGSIIFGCCFVLSTAFILGERAVKMYLFLENNKAIVIKTIAEINLKNTVLYSARLENADRFFSAFFLPRAANM